MAAVHSSRQSNRIPQSDPFGDPAPRPTSSSKKQRAPPPPPPKQPSSARMPPSTNSSHHDITEAVRDTVAFKSSMEAPPRAKPHRSATQTVAPVSSSRPTGKRGQSEDSNITEKPRSSGKSRSAAKKGSQHADVIDRLDFTGVGPMFHHDGPFDACAPSRNKHRNKAPLYAWDGDEAAAPQAYGDSAYPAPAAYKAFSNDYPDPPKKKVDAIAEAWGIHEPEPFEEFFAGGGTGRAEGDTPASSIYNGRDNGRSAAAATSSRRPKEAESRNRQAARRSVVPPPQPIFVGEPAEVDVVGPPGSGSPPATSPGFPKRSRSLMHRIRKMRDAPNVPVGNEYEPPMPPSPSTPTDPNAQTSPRPSHRAQNSFLGRFAGNSSGGGSANQSSSATEPFVFIEATPHHNKDLPAPPQMEQAISGSYFDQQGGTGTSPPGANGLGHKASIMKKVGRVVRGSK